MNAQYISDDMIRDGIRIIKDKFLKWRIPSIELPADSVIEACVKEILELKDI